MFLRPPGFAALVVMTLAAGIGAATAAMNVAAHVLLMPLPVGDESRLVPRSRDTVVQVSPFDAGAMAAGWAVLALVSVGAALGPLYRVRRIDPASLLRSN